MPMRLVLSCSLSPALQASIIDEAALGMVSSLVACKVLIFLLELYSFQSISCHTSLALDVVATQAQ